ncbi:MAG: hypothetical protein QG608_2926 [Actinomycetota bacterium]|nr:hypothetical protein [Actinomycetota bacterium]
MPSPLRASLLRAPLLRTALSRVPLSRVPPSGPGRGSVTAEIALVLPAVVLLLALVLATGALTAAQMDCVDAARGAARLAARREPSTEVIAAARALAPPGADVTVRTQGAQALVTVSAVVALPLPGTPRAVVRSTASSRLEQPDDTRALRGGPDSRPSTSFSRGPGLLTRGRAFGGRPGLPKTCGGPA